MYRDEANEERNRVHAGKLCIAKGSNSSFQAPANLTRLLSQGQDSGAVLLVIEGELESWVSYVDSDCGPHGVPEVSKLLSRRICTLTVGDTIGDVDRVLRRPNLASVIVSSDSCQLVQLSEAALSDILERREGLVPKMARLALAHEHHLLDASQVAGHGSHGAGLLTHDQAGASGEAAALCSSAVFVSR